MGNQLLPPIVEGKGLAFAKSWEAAASHQRASGEWRKQLIDIACAQFTWEGLPPHLPAYQLEWMLLNSSPYTVLCFLDGSDTLVAGRCVPTSILDIYNRPTDVMVYFQNASIEPLERNANRFDADRDAVWAMDNNLGHSTLTTIDYYADRLERLDRVIDVNLMTQQYPFIIETHPDARKSAQAFAQQVMGGEAVVFTTPQMQDIIKTTVHDMKSPYVGDKVLADQRRILQRFLTVMGIDNSNGEKKERLIDAEASGNDEEVNAYRRSRLACRRDLCREVNEVLGLDLNVYLSYTRSIVDGDLVSQKMRPEDYVAADLGKEESGI